MTRSREFDYAIHEASHAVVAHVSGFTVERIRIEPENSRGACDIDRGFDPDEACYFVRNHAREKRTAELLPLLKRDLAGRLAGMISDDMFGINGSQAEYDRDRTVAGQLARDIAHASWVRSDPRPDFSSRERPEQYIERMTVFVRERLLGPHLAAIEALAEDIVARSDSSGASIRELLDQRGVGFNSVSDEQLP